MKKYSQGQALVSLLVFSVIAMAIISAATVLIVNSMYGTTSLERGSIAKQIAESGAENAILRLLRDPGYTGETLPVGDGTATITVSGANPRVITSQGRSGDYLRTVQITADYTNILNIISWKEIY